MTGLTWLHERLHNFVGIQPYWHPLGFVSCFLNRGDQQSIRLHYWPANDRRPKTPNWPIHTHVFDLKSIILAGRVRDRQYRLANGNAYTVYIVRYNGIDSTIVPTDQQTDVVVSCDVVRPTGATYCVPVGTFHETVVEIADETLTLVVCTNFQAADPLVLGRAGDAAYPYQRAAFDSAQFWSRVERALAKPGIESSTRLECGTC
jgi:hypothetical protein